MRRLILIAVVVMAVVAVAPVSAFAFGGPGGFGSTQAGESDLEMLYQEALHKLEGEGDFEGAVVLFESVAKKAEEISAIGAKALLHKGEALERLGRADDAVEAYRAAAEAAAGSRVAAGARRALVRMGAQEPVREVSDEERLKARLEKRVPTFDFPQTSFDVVVGVLRQLEDGLNIVVSPKVATDEQISLVLTNTTIADILSYVTRMTNLRWTIWKGAVYISDWQEIALIEQEKAVEEARAPVAEAAAPVSVRPAVDDDLMAAMQSLFKARMEAARNEVRRAAEMHEKGRAPMSEVEDAQIKVLEAAVALRALARGSDAEIRSLLAGTLAGSADVKRLLDSAKVGGPAEYFAEVPDAKADYRPIPGAEEVILYDVRIANFAGAQLFDLDTGKSIPYRGARTDFFAENPGFDLCFTGHEVMVQVLGDTSLQDGAVILNNPCQAGFLPAGTDLAALPADVSLPEVNFDTRIGTKDGRLLGPAQYMLRISELPFVLVTDRGRYIARIQRVNEDSLRLEYKRLEDLPGRAAALLAKWAEKSRGRLDESIAKEVKRRDDASDPFNNDDLAQGVRASLSGHVWDIQEYAWLASSAQKQAFAAYREKVEAEAARLDEYYAGFEPTEVDPRPPEYAPDTITALDLDTGETARAEEGQGVKEFLAANPAFDVAHNPAWRGAGRWDVFVLNKGLSTAPLSRLEELPVVQEPVEYREPQALPEGFAEAGVNLTPDQLPGPGIYAYPDGYLVSRSSGALLVQTDSGKYVVRLRGDGRVRYWKAMRPLDPDDVDIPPLPAELTGAPAASVSVEIHETTLADADIDTPAPQALDFDTGETLSFPSDDTEQDEWFAAHPHLDLFYDRQLILMGENAQAALLPPGTWAASGRVVIGGEMAFNYSPAPSSPGGIEGPGVYVAEHPRMGRFIVIEPGEHPIYVETAGGAYFIKVTDRAKDFITFDWQRISPKR